MSTGSANNLTTLVLIVGDRSRLLEPATNLLDALRYFIGQRSDADSIHIVIDGPAWRAALPDEKLAMTGVKISVLEQETHLPGALIEHALASVESEFLSFLWPGVEVSTWFANKPALLAGIGRAAMACGYRGSGERRQFATQSFLSHPDDGLSPEAPRAWLQMLDLAPMANCLLRIAACKNLGGFSLAPALQRSFWWEFCLRLTAGEQIVSLPLQPIPSSGWHTYPFTRVLGLSTDLALRRMMWAQSDRARTVPLQPDELEMVAAGDRLDADPVWHSLPMVLRNRLETIRGQRPLRILVLGGINEPAHNQLCFFNYFERMRDWGVVSWRTTLDTLAHPADLAFCDLVIFSRVRSANGVQLMDFCHSNGIRTLYMLDDNWFWLGREWQEYAGIFAPGLPDYENFLHCLRHADVALTYNPTMAADLSPHAKKLVQIPTNVDLSVFPVAARDDAAPVTIGYVGSLRKNLAPFAALVAIARARKDVRILIMSNALPEEFAALPPEQVEFHPYQFNYAGYARTVCAARPDVLVAPIGNSRFEAGKCPNKFLEITACGAAGVYSRAEPYLSAVREGETGLFAGEDSEEWRRQIERLIDDAALRKRIAAQAMQVVQTEFDTGAVLPALLPVLLDAAGAQ